MAADERPKGLTVQGLIHQLTADYVDPTAFPIVSARFFMDDEADRRCVIKAVTVRANGVWVDLEPEVWDR